MSGEPVEIRKEKLDELETRLDDLKTRIENRSRDGRRNREEWIQVMKEYYRTHHVQLLTASALTFLSGLVLVIYVYGYQPAGADPSGYRTLTKIAFAVTVVLPLLIGSAVAAAYDKTPRWLDGFYRAFFASLY